MSASIAPTEEEMQVLAQFFREHCTDSTPKRTECAWCSTVMSPGAEPVSHSCCPTCRVQHFPQEAMTDGH